MSASSDFTSRQHVTPETNLTSSQPPVGKENEAAGKAAASSSNKRRKDRVFSPIAKNWSNQSSVSSRPLRKGLSSEPPPSKPARPSLLNADYDSVLAAYSQSQFSSRPRSLSQSVQSRLSSESIHGSISSVPSCFAPPPSPPAPLISHSGSSRTSGSSCRRRSSASPPSLARLNARVPLPSAGQFDDALDGSSVSVNPNPKRSKPPGTKRVLGNCEKQKLDTESEKAEVRETEIKRKSTNPFDDSFEDEEEEEDVDGDEQHLSWQQQGVPVVKVVPKVALRKESTNPFDSSFSDDSMRDDGAAQNPLDSSIDSSIDDSCPLSMASPDPFADPGRQRAYAPHVAAPHAAHSMSRKAFLILNPSSLSSSSRSSLSSSSRSSSSAHEAPGKGAKRSLVLHFDDLEAEVVQPLQEWRDDSRGTNEEPISYKPISTRLSEGSCSSASYPPSPSSPFKALSPPFQLKPLLLPRYKKLILLEGLTTFSTVLLLILPYIALITSAFLDSSKVFVSRVHVPAGAGLQSVQDDAFTFSTSLPALPPFSSFLVGDATYSNLNIGVLKAISSRDVLFTTAIRQRREGVLETIFETKPALLPIVCHASETTELHTRSYFTCSSPRLLDVLFSAPGTKVLSYAPVEVEIRYFPSSLEMDPTTVYALGKIIDSASYDIEHESRTYSIIMQIIRTITMFGTFSFIVFYFHEIGDLRLEVRTKRLFAMFRGYREAIVGTYRSRLQAAGAGARSTESRFLSTYGSSEVAVQTAMKQEDKGNDILVQWWLSPWTMVPERRYIAALLMCCIFLQNPIVYYMQFDPSKMESEWWRLAADMMVGIGIFTGFFCWLCLLRGLRYHTDRSITNRTKKHIELENAIETRSFVRRSRNVRLSNTTDIELGADDDDDAAELSPLLLRTRLVTVVASEGDSIDPVSSNAASSLVLMHDPFGPYWEYFLVPKLLMLIVSILSLAVTVVTRYPSVFLTSDMMDPATTSIVDTIYLTSSILQLCIVSAWMVLICSAALKTSRVLRRQSFMITRHAQLAFQVMVSILVLAVFALLAPSVYDFVGLVKKWTFPHNAKSGRIEELINSFESGDIKDEEDTKLSKISSFVFGESKRGMLERLVRIFASETSHLSFCSTAANLGPGKLLYVTACCLTVGIIFLLPNKSESSVAADEGGDDERKVVNLTSQTHSWRTFPLPVSLNSHRDFNPTINCTSGRLANSRRGDDKDGSCYSIMEGPYAPIYCNEIASLLLECSWQSYYNTTEYSSNVAAPGVMNLESMGLRLFQEIVDVTTDTHAFVCVNTRELVKGDSRHLIVVFFRGTVSGENVKTDLRWEQVRLPPSLVGESDGRAAFRVEGCAVKATGIRDRNDAFRISSTDDSSEEAGFFGLHCPAVHKGFLRSYIQVRERVFSAVFKCVENELARGRTLPKLYVTGHSLGGALAQIFSLDLACNVEVPVGGADGEVICQMPLCCYTYGQPRVGNSAFATLFEQRVPHCFRVAVEGDLFVGVPKYSLVSSRGVYFHAGNEVVLDDLESGDITVRPTVVDRAFRFTKANVSVVNHSLTKYRECLENAFEEEELVEYYHNVWGKGRRKGMATPAVPDWVVRK